MVINDMISTGSALYHTTARTKDILATRTAYVYPEGGNKQVITGIFGTPNYETRGGQQVVVSVTVPDTYIKLYE